MIDHRDINVVRIPIDQITIMNPRERGKVKFRQIVTNISSLGLKKPITVVQRGSRDGKSLYELVCGQGRLEACRQLGDTTVPALVIDASREDLLLMSLAENLARRRQTSVEMLREIGNLKERGYSIAEIAQKTDLNQSYVKGILRLLKQGETRLIEAVEGGQIPINIAVTIATSEDQEVQRALAEAYESKSLRGKQLLKARRLIEVRRVVGKSMRYAGRKNPKKLLNSDTLMQAYKRESAKQRLLVHKAKVCETRLLFVASALKQLFADREFVAILQSAKLVTLPQFLADQIGRNGG
ncbi:MAG: ParB/RepB/Spo0J family partition protein [Phycisphaeraceae bacterium]|nr:ParB/RepB/Spo0J family partition protein [Phycisphaeraceae bacterium]